MRNMAATANKSPQTSKSGALCFMCASVICSLLQLATAQQAPGRHELSRMAKALTWFAPPAAARDPGGRTSQRTSGWCVWVLRGAAGMHRDDNNNISDASG